MAPPPPGNASAIRPALPEDLDAVARLAARLVRYHHALDPERYLLVEPLEEGYRWFLGGELENPQAVILVAEREGRVVGYTYGRCEPRNWNDLLEACGKLHDLFVDEAARGEGLARRLVEETVSRLSAMGAPRVLLLTAAQNAPAQRLFERLGFRRTMIEMTRETPGTKEGLARAPRRSGPRGRSSSGTEARGRR